MKAARLPSAKSSSCPATGMLRPLSKPPRRPRPTERRCSSSAASLTDAPQKLPHQPPPQKLQSQLVLCSVPPALIRKSRPRMPGAGALGATVSIWPQYLSSRLGSNCSRSQAKYWRPLSLARRLDDFHYQSAALFPAMRQMKQRSNNIFALRQSLCQDCRSVSRSGCSTPMACLAAVIQLPGRLLESFYR